VEKYKVRNQPQFFIDSNIAVIALTFLKPCTYVINSAPSKMKVSAFTPTQTTQTISASGTNGSSHLMAVTSSNDNTPDRRAFMKRSVGIFTSGMATGGYVNFESHAPNCNCSSCLGNDHAEGCACGNCASGKEHSLGCQCSNCFRFGPLSAVAYERDVGDDNRSPESYAQNLQVSDRA
jgi:hypothetical protein